MLGEIVIRFTTHGCMAHIHEFDYIGVIVKYVKHGEHLYYRVSVSKDKKRRKKGRQHRTGI